MEKADAKARTETAETRKAATIRAAAHQQRAKLCIAKIALVIVTHISCS